MEKIKILDLENDGVNMAMDEWFIYIRCKRSVFKYEPGGMEQIACNTVFAKDGKSRGISVHGEFIFLTDFCDLYILHKSDLQVIKVIRIGSDLSSDVGGVRFDSQKAYISVRNGKMAVMDIKTFEYEIFDLGNSTFWDHCVTESSIYAGNVQGELLEICKADMTIGKKAQISKKNIYSTALCDGFIYTVSQDMAIRIISADSFEITAEAKKAVRGMAKILGVHNNNVVVADSNKITLWDRQTLSHCDTVAFPTGSYNKGVILSGNGLLGSDKSGIYSAAFD